MKNFIDFGIDVGGHTTGEHKALCPQCSHTRKKKNLKVLNVNVDKGVWNCWHCSWSGTLKGGEWQKPEVRKVYTKPVFVKVDKKTDELQAWFDTRGISAEVVQRNQITLGKEYFPQVEEERGCVLFPYFRGEEVINIKYRTRDKLFRMASGAERILYGINDINPEVLVWVEGEIDKLSVEMAGLTSCVSVPDGAPAADSKSYSNKFDFLTEKALEAVKLHIIAVDSDEPGVRLQEELVRRLGREKCLIVVWPKDCKDANEVLLTHGVETLADCIANARALPIEGTYSVDDIIESIFNDYEYGPERGVSTSWAEMDDTYRVMTGEWTLVTGIPGHGKSEWLDALALNLSKHYGWNFGIFSPENQPLKYHVEKLTEKIVGKPFSEGFTERMSFKEMGEALKFVNDHFHFMLPDYPTVDGLLDTSQQLVLRHGIRGLIIDPWNEINPARDGNVTETDYISQALTKIRTFARRNQVHVWLVAHPTKLQKDKTSGAYPVPTPYDVSGSAHWRNKADNCITVYRDMVQHGSPVQVHVQKVRKKSNGKVGMVEFDYDHICGRYKPYKKNVLPNTYSMRKVQKEAA
ncbi:DnaB-like helicase C-terminal domain-containing protein [Paraburkholderia elongata]|uniref:Toprim domain-containing protein n=1 Tax=Paraburkholderia elongata TaxID=2675747 RepID=A0A972SLF0_9BURK|nr:DnaB-like helicase C-terminal domain-containing protein [Paraburkholderia elongata]NPT59067.1 toprim domain-containing protein [Paraburkholderia elongata]